MTNRVFDVSDIAKDVFKNLAPLTKPVSIISWIMSANLGEPNTLLSNKIKSLRSPYCFAITAICCLMEILFL